jgi:hypothetical protein
LDVKTQHIKAKGKEDKNLWIAIESLENCKIRKETLIQSCSQLEENELAHTLFHWSEYVRLKLYIGVVINKLVDKIQTKLKPRSSQAQTWKDVETLTKVGIWTFRKLN